MVLSAIWEKHAQVSFSKTYKIAQVRRTSAICAFLKNSRVCVFPKFHKKPYYYLIIIYIVARDLPGGKQSLVINMMAQHITFNKAIKPIKI